MSLFVYFLWCGFTGLAEEGVPGLMRHSGLCVWGHQGPLLMYELWGSEVSCASRGSGPRVTHVLCRVQPSVPTSRLARLGSSLMWPHRPAWPLCPPGTRVLALPFWLPCSAFSPGFTVTTSEGLQAAGRPPMGSCFLPPGTCLPLALFCLRRARVPSGPRRCPELPHPAHG